MAGRRFQISRDALAALCRRHHIRSLAFFGSVLRDDFCSESDVDVLVEFEPGRGPGFIALSGIEEELSALFGGRKVDLVTAKFLNPRIRPRVMSEAQVQYAEG